MEALARMRVDLIARTEAFQRDIRNAAQQFENAGRSMQRAGRTMSTRVTLPLAAIGAASVKMAVDAEESANKFNVVMGDSADAVRERFKELHDIIPLTTSEMESLAAGVQDLLVPLGLARDDAAGMSADMVELAADLASFNNVAADVPLDAIKSALAGMSRPLRSFGVDVSQARLETLAYEEGLIGVGEELTSAARAQAVMIAIQRDSSDAVGDAAATANSAANTFRRFMRDVKELGQTVGEILVPHVVALVQRLNGLLKWLRDLDPATQRWIVRIAGAAAAIGPLFIVLGTLLRSLAALSLMLTPAGALVAGLTIVAGIIGTNLVRSQIAAAKEARDLEDALAGVGGSLRQLGEEASRVALAQFQRGLLEARAQAESLREEIERAKSEAREPSGRFGLGLEMAGVSGEARRLQAELDEANQRVEEMERLVQEARDAFFDLGEAAGNAPDPVEVVNDALSTTTDLLAAALDLDINRAEILNEAAARRDRINGLLEAGVGSLEQEIELTKEVSAINDALTENVNRRINLREKEIQLVGTALERQRGFTERQLQFHRDLGRASGELVVKTIEWAGAAEKVGSNIAWTREQARGMIDVVADGATVFEDAWMGAIHAVGAAFGGMASRFANVLGAFATGGAAAGIPAAIGAMAGLIGGGRESTRSQTERQMAEEAARAEEATARLTQRLAEFAAQADLVGTIAQRVAKINEEWAAIVRELEAEFGMAMFENGKFAEAMAAWGANLAAVRSEVEQDIQLRTLQARGMTEEAAALKRQIERQREMADVMALQDPALTALLEALFKAEDAARQAAEAEAELAAFRQQQIRELDIAARELALLGDDFGALSASLQSARDAELNAARDMLESGEITLDFFNRIARLLDGEMAAALAAYEEGLAAQIGALEDEIAVRELLVAGLDAEADLLRLEIRQRQELAEAIALVGDESDELIRRLLDLQEAEREALQAREIAREADEIAARTGAATARMGETIASARSITEATGARMGDLLFAQLAIQRQIEVNTRGARYAGASDFQPAPSGGFRASTVAQTVRLHVSVQDDRIQVTSSDPNISIDVVDQGLGARSLTRTRLDGDMRVGR